MWLLFALLPHHRIASLLLAPWNNIESSRQIDYFKTQKLKRRICCRVCLGENLNTRILFTQPIRNNLITDNWQTWWILSGSEILYMFSGIWRKKKAECTKESIAKMQNGKQCHLPLEVPSWNTLEIDIKTFVIPFPCQKSNGSPEDARKLSM